MCGSEVLNLILHQKMKTLKEGSNLELLRGRLPLDVQSCLRMNEMLVFAAVS